MSTNAVDKPKVTTPAVLPAGTANPVPVEGADKKAAPAATTTTADASATPADAKATPTPVERAAVPATDTLEPAAFNRATNEALLLQLSRRGLNEVTGNANSCSIGGSTVVNVVAIPRTEGSPTRRLNLLDSPPGSAASVCGPGTDAAALGVRRAMDDIRNSTVDPATVAMTAAGNAQYVMTVPGNIEAAETTIATRLHDERQKLHEQFPQLAVRHREIMAAMQADPQIASSGMNLEALQGLADRMLAREILRMQNVTTSIEGPRTIAMPTMGQQLLLIPLVVDQLEKTGQISSDAANYLRGQTSMAQTDLKGQSEALLQRVAPHLGRLLSTEILMRMISLGEIPANLNDQELRVWMDGFLRDQQRRMLKAKLWGSPEERQRNAEIIQRGLPQVRAAMPHRDYQEAAVQAITNTLEGKPGSHAVLRTQSGAIVPVTRENVQRHFPQYTQLRAYYAAYGSTSASPGAVSLADFLAGQGSSHTAGTLATVRNERERREQGAATLARAARSQDTVRAIREEDRRTELAEVQVGRNLQTRALNNGQPDPGPLSTTRLA